MADYEEHAEIAQRAARRAAHHATIAENVLNRAEGEVARANEAWQVARRDYNKAADEAKAAEVHAAAWRAIAERSA